MHFGSKSEFNDPHVQAHRRSAAKRPNRPADALESILQEVSEDLDQPVDPRVSLLKDRWSEIAGEQIAKHSQPQYIDRFILYIQVNHPGWMPELQKAKRPILSRVQQAFANHRPIRDVRFTLLQR